MGQAISRQQQLESEFRGIAVPSWNRATGLTAEQLTEAEASFARLNGKSLLAAVEYYLTHFKGEPVKILLVEAKAKFIAEKVKLNRRPATILNLEDRLGRFVKAHPLKQVGEATPADIQAFIELDGKGQYAQAGDRLVLTGFFSWAKKRNYCASNPVDDVNRVRIEREDVSVIGLEGARRIVSAAAAYREGLCLPYVSLALFCAIRPREIPRLDWSAIDLDSGTVTVGAKIAKMRQRRIVEIPPNALALLKTVKDKPLYGPNFRSNLDAIKREAGDPKAFVQDVMRHTAISYHLALHQNEGKTAEWAGNSPDIIHRHYRALVKAVDVAEFWRIGLGQSNSTPQDNHS